MGFLSHFTNKTFWIFARVWLFQPPAVNSYLFLLDNNISWKQMSSPEGPPCVITKLAPRSASNELSRLSFSCLSGGYLDQMWSSTQQMAVQYYSPSSPFEGSAEKWALPEWNSSHPKVDVWNRLDECPSQHFYFSLATIEEACGDYLLCQSLHCRPVYLGKMDQSFQLSFFQLWIISSAPHTNETLKHLEQKHDFNIHVRGCLTAKCWDCTLGQFTENLVREMQLDFNMHVVHSLCFALIVLS